MAQSYTTNDGITLVDPGTYVSLQVINNQSGIANAGIVTLVGEADAGPDYTEEADLDANSFGPDQLASVQQKYGTGRIVDAFRAIVAAANDPQIVGSVSLIKIVKTNPSLAAFANLTRSGFGQYSKLTADQPGATGNLVQFGSTAAVAEVAPQTGSFSYVPHYLGSPVAFGLRNNGGTPNSYSIPELTSGPTFASDVESLANGVLAQGANEVDPLTSLTGTNIAASAVDASTLLITLSGAFTTVPAVGDTLVIPDAATFGATTASVLAGAGSANLGSYIITTVVPGVSTSTVTAKRINAPGVNPCVNVSATPISAGALDIITYKPINIQNITGQDRTSLNPASGSYGYVVSGNSVVITPPAPFAAQPQVGDYLKIPAALGTLNAGFYSVTASTSTTVTATRLSNGSPGTSGATVATTPFSILRRVIDGLGKATEVTGTLSPIAWNSSTLTAVTFGNSLLTSADEYENSFVVSYSSPTAGLVSNTYLSGGSIGLSIGCSQASATAVVGPTGIAFKVGATTIFTATYQQFTTLTTLVSYINSQSTFSATLLTPKLGNSSPSALDEGTYGISSSIAAQPGRIKEDAFNWFTNLSGDPFVAPTQPAAGLPELIAPNQFLSGGTRAGSTSANFVGAIDACQGVITNFMVPLISANASVDIAEGDTDPTSTYTVDSINAYLSTHVNFMSAVLQRQNRVGIVSREGTFAAQQQASQTINNFRIGMAFQDVMVTNSAGLTQQYQSWMAAVIAAGMQAAAGYKGIVKKFANITGIIKPEGDFNPMNGSQVRSALQSGLMPLEKVTTGGFRWISDQMTYTVDNNFVYNSLQAVYIADLMALTLIQAFDNAVVGKSIAQISAAGALSFLDGQMFNFRRLNWIAPSIDAPKGYKNASVKLTGGVMLITVEAKLAGLIYFVPITFTVSQVQQSASQ